VGASIVVQVQAVGMIYNDRPPVCRGFACQWLISPELSEEWKLSRCKIVVRMTVAEGSQTFDGLDHEGALTCRFVVGPAAPNQWRQEPFYKTIKTIALGGLVDANANFETMVSANAVGSSFLMKMSKLPEVARIFRCVPDPTSGK
jgi:hypothetical protein